jgi:hypothetical protein
MALDHAQFPPRALLNQALGELSLLGDTVAARRHARDALAWLRQRDISPPAVARLSERIGDIAARTGDEATVVGLIALIDLRDHGRGLRSFELARQTLNAELAYVRGDFATAAVRAERARHGVYFWRSLLTIVQLESSARRASGEPARADSLRRLLVDHRIVDGDFEVWLLLRSMPAG